MVRVVVADVVETTFYKKLYKNKVVDHNKKGYCAKFEVDVTNIFDENNQKDLTASCFQALPALRGPDA